jgi:starvation-inducible DNA-binding protein
MNGNESLAYAIDASLCDLICLELLAKQARWNVHGPGFRSLHLLLDDVAQCACRCAEELAERAITLGHHPDGRAATVARTSTIDLHAGALVDVDVLAAFEMILEVVTGRLHDALDATPDDPVTHDVLTRIAARIEQHACLVRAHR